MTRSLVNRCLVAIASWLNRLVLYLFQVFLHFAVLLPRVAWSLSRFLRHPEVVPLRFLNPSTHEIAYLKLVIQTCQPLRRRQGRPGSKENIHIFLKFDSDIPNKQCGSESEHPSSDP